MYSLIMRAGAFGWGAASDRFGTRIVVLIGAVLLGLALGLASRAASLVQFQQPVTAGIGSRNTASENIAPMARHVISAPAPTITQR